MAHRIGQTLGIALVGSADEMGSPVTEDGGTAMMAEGVEMVEKVGEAAMIIAPETPPEAAAWAMEMMRWTIMQSRRKLIVEHKQIL